MTRKQGPSYQLTFEDAVNIWHRHWDGEFQHRIAASYDVNPGRVAEVLKGRRHPVASRRREQGIADQLERGLAGGCAGKAKAVKNSENVPNLFSLLSSGVV